MNEELKLFSFGYIPDIPDKRDYKFKVAQATTLAPIDLRPEMRPIKNQGALGACTAFATTAMVEYVRAKQKFLEWDASPLFTYYATRKIENTIDIDSGASVRDALKSIINNGVVKEVSWPYVIESFAVPPPSAVWVEAETHQAISYFSVDQTKESILGCLSEGYPFTFGAKLYDSFTKSQNGFFVSNLVPMPDLSADKYLGGHCMLAVGYTSASDDNIQIIVRNSWGNWVGLDGYHFMSLQYFLDPSLSMDFWTLRTEEITPEDIIPDPPSPPAPEPVVPPTPVPSPLPIPDIPSVSIWKKPSTYFLIAFAIVALLFALL